MFSINDSFVTDDLAALAEILNPVEEQTLKLEEGENRVVSVLFLDIKGFTAMSEKMNPEEVKLTMDKVLTVFTNSILKYGGYIDKYEGDLIMALFGCKTASETDTERAISAGLKILSDIKHINQILKIDLAVRIGINTGEVTTGKIGMKRDGDFTVYGDAVNLASRMENDAPINSIMIPEETKAMVENSFLFEDLGVISVKGKEKSISVWKVTGFSPKKVERWERSSSIIKHSLYVGRDSEINQIRELYRISKSEIGTIDPKYKPVIIGLKGAAGIGKSRLVKELFTIAKQQNNYLFGYTKSFAQPPYYLFTTMLKRYFKIEELDSREIVQEKINVAYANLIQITKSDKLLNEARNVVGFLFGVKYDDIRLEKVEQKTLQTLVTISIRHTIESIAQVVNQKTNEPLIIFLDDCQWLDESSMALLKTFLIALNAEVKLDNRVNHNLFIMLTYRPEFVPFGEFQHDARFTEFELNPLTASNTQELIDSLIGRNSFPPDFVQLIQQQSGGNPFYVEELVSYLAEKGEISIYDGIVVLDKKLNSLQIPLSLKNIILSRIDNLSDNLKKLLLRASIIGYRFFKSVLSEISLKLEQGKGIDAEFNELHRDNWIFNEIEDNYLFKHILTADVCYATILNYNKKIIHRMIAETIEELFQADLQEYYADLAHHYEKAGVIDKIIEFLQKAGDNAKKSYQNAKALEFYDKLLGYLDEEKDAVKLIDILNNKGEILELIGKNDEAETIYQKAINLSNLTDDKKLIVRCNNSMALLISKKGRFEEALMLLEKAILIAEEVRDEYGYSVALGNLSTLHFSKGDFDKSMLCSLEHKKICLKINNKRGYSSALGNLGNICCRTNDYAQAMHFYNEGKRICLEIDDVMKYAGIVGNSGNIYLDNGEYDQALACFEEYKQISLKNGMKEDYAIAVGNIGNVNLYTGNYDQAIQCYIEKKQICHELGFKSEYSNAVGNLGYAFLDRGDYNKAIECFEEKKDICIDLGYRRGYSMAVGSIGDAYFTIGEFEKAMQNYEEQKQICTELGDKKGFSNSICGIGTVYNSLGKFDLALQCYEEGKQICFEIGDKDGYSLVIGNMGSVYYDQEKYDMAEVCFEEVINITRELGTKYYLCNYLHSKAVLLFDTKKMYEAKLSNKEALQIAKELEIKDIVLSATILNHKLLAHDNQPEAVSNLTKMLEFETESENIATIHYEIYKINKSTEHCKSALDLYQELYTKTPKFDYKKKIDELAGTASALI